MSDTRLCLLQRRPVTVSSGREQAWVSEKVWLLGSNSAIQSILQGFAILFCKLRTVRDERQCCYKIDVSHAECLVQDLQNDRHLVLRSSTVAIGAFPLFRCVVCSWSVPIVLPL